MRESQIEKRLVKEAKRLGGRAVKFVSPGWSGVPDRIVLFKKGRLAFIELKAPGETLRPLQEKRKRQLEDFGFRVYVIDDVEQIGEMLGEIRGL